MHIPDGFLNVNTLAPAWIISVSSLGYCLRKASKALKEKTVPLMGVMAAFIFASQMVNFPVVPGTSVHVLGAALAGILLGPYAAAIVLTCVLIVQCLVFQDGGLVALGANIFNMAIAANLTGFLVYKFVRFITGDTKRVALAAGLGAWISVVIAASLCIIELAVSGVMPLKIIFLPIIGLYALTGIAEAFVTCLIIEFVLKIRPDLIYALKKSV